MNCFLIVGIILLILLAATGIAYWLGYLVFGKCEECPKCPACPAPPACVVPEPCKSYASDPGLAILPKDPGVWSDNDRNIAITILGGYTGFNTTPTANVIYQLTNDQLYRLLVGKYK